MFPHLLNCSELLPDSLDYDSLPYSLDPNSLPDSCVLCLPWFVLSSDYDPCLFIDQTLLDYPLKLIILVSGFWVSSVLSL